MSAVENSSGIGSSFSNAAVSTAQQMAVSEAEKAIAAKSAKTKNTIDKVQQGMQYTQTAQSLPGGLNHSSDSSSANSINTAGNNIAAPDENINAAIAAADIAGIIHVVALQIIINGNVFSHFESFQLQQSASSHHSFRLVLQHDVLSAEQDHSMEDARQFLGSRISVTFKYKRVLQNSPEREFIGIITQVGFSQSHGSRGSIVLTGQSPTALLDAAPHTQSFGGENPISLSSIAKEVIKQGIGESRFDVAVNPNYKGNLLYSSQYHESHHNYLSRMAAAYGEWYFYDGRVLYFGKPSANQTPITLIYGKDTQQVQLQMKTLHINRQHYGYNSSNHQPLTTGSTEATGLGELGMYASDASKKIFTAPSLAWSPVRAVSDKDVETTQKSAIGSVAAEVFTLTGSTTVPFLYPGCVIEMNFRKPGSSDVKYFSKLIVTAVTHSLDARGHYQGQFEAIPAETAYLPAPAYTIPNAQPQMAIVKDNKDKDSQGRIRVQFDWQSGTGSTDFIRMMSPDAGGSDKVSKNRGFMAIPEPGDQVMIGFVHNHPDRPFAMGGMFHGKVGAGGGAGNNIKSLSSKSGHTVSLDDGGGISIKDKAGNIVHVDGEGNITASSSATNAVDVGKGAAKMKMDNGGCISIEANTKIELKVGASALTITPDTIALKTNNNTITADSNKLTGANHITGGDTKIDGGNVFIN